MAASKQPILLFFVFYLNKAVSCIILSDLIYIFKAFAMNWYFKNPLLTISVLLMARNSVEFILKQDIYYNWKSNFYILHAIKVFSYVHPYKVLLIYLLYLSLYQNRITDHLWLQKYVAFKICALISILTLGNEWTWLYLKLYKLWTKY